MSTAVEIRLEQSGPDAYTATSFVDGNAFVFATDTTEPAAARACMVLTRATRPGETFTFRLPYVGKSHMVAWFEKPRKLEPAEAAGIRKRWKADESVAKPKRWKTTEPTAKPKRSKSQQRRDLEAQADVLLAHLGEVQ